MSEKPEPKKLAAPTIFGWPFPLPDQFYAIKQEVSPLANVKLLMIVTGLLYLSMCGTFAAFLAYYITHPTTKADLQIQANQLPAEQGWKCSILTTNSEDTSVSLPSPIGYVALDRSDLVDSAVVNVPSGATFFFTLTKNIEATAVYSRTYFESFDACVYVLKTNIYPWDGFNIVRRLDSPQIYLDTPLYQDARSLGFVLNQNAWQLDLYYSLDNGATRTSLAWSTTSPSPESEFNFYQGVLTSKLMKNPKLLPENDGLYKFLCDPYTYLPPYSCFRLEKVYKPNVEILSLSVANTSLIFGLLLGALSAVFYLQHKRHMNKKDPAYFSRIDVPAA